MYARLWYQCACLLVYCRDWESFAPVMIPIPSPFIRPKPLQQRPGVGLHRTKLRQGRLRASLGASLGDRAGAAGLRVPGVWSSCEAFECKAFLKDAVRVPYTTTLMRDCGLNPLACVSLKLSALVLAKRSVPKPRLPILVKLILPPLGLGPLSVPFIMLQMLGSPAVDEARASVLLILLVSLPHTAP